MPTISLLIVGCIVGVFLIFAGTLAYGDYASAQVRKNRELH